MLDAEVDPAVGFQSLEMMWLIDPPLRAAVLSPRIGGIAGGTHRNPLSSSWKNLVAAVASRHNAAAILKHMWPRSGVLTMPAHSVAQCR
jgi:hypothetical protein